MAPVASPLSLKRKSQCSQLAGSFPATPAKKLEDTRPADSDKHDVEVSTPSPSIRERRGRRNLTNGSFQLLSIFTKSLLLPFDLDIEKGFDVLKGDSPDRLEEAKQALTPDYKRIKVTEERENDKPAQTPDNPSRGISFAMATHIMGSCRDSEMDLMTALAITSPEKDATRKIHAEFATLYELPVPESSQHPTFSSNPFESTTDIPLLSTSTCIDEIRLHNPKSRRSDESNARTRQDSIERKRSFFGLDFKTPASAKSRNAFSVDDSPLPLPLSTVATGGSSARSSSSPSTFDSAQPKNSASTTSSHGIRKFSDMFKARTSMERSEPSSPTWSSRMSSESPNLDRQDLERYVRRTTNTATYDHDPTSPYPRHPNTGRGWKSRNLKCTTCLDESCACCGRVCCAYRAAVLALDIHLEGTSGRALALQRIQEITKVYPYGKEVPTFLQCTAGLIGDGLGCGKLVCPDCCSICPDEACGDTQCRKCKSQMWEECTWHKGISFI